MKKRLLSILLVVGLLVSLATVASARASLYLDDYGISITAKGKGKISTDVIINGVKTMSKIGVYSYEIQEKTSVDGKWHTYEVRYGSDDPDTYYWNDSYTYCNSFGFGGTPGYYYRVILTAYAGNSTGHDTGVVISSQILCK